MGFLDSFFAPFSSGNEFDAYQAQRQGYNQGARQYNQYVQQGLGELKDLYGQAGKFYEALPQQYDPRNPYARDLASRGGGYLDAYNNALGLNGRRGAQQAFRGYKAMPGFDFQLKTANQATERAAAGSGLLGSGNTLGQISENSRKMAESSYGSYLDRLGSMASMGYGGIGTAAGIKNSENQFGAQYGLNLAGAQAGLNTGYGGQIMNAYTGMGNVANQAQQGIGQAQGSYLTSLDQTGANIWGTGLAIAGTALGMPYMSGATGVPGQAGYSPGTRTTLGAQGLQYLFA